MPWRGGENTGKHELWYTELFALVLFPGPPHWQIKTQHRDLVISAELETANKMRAYVQLVFRNQ